MTTEPITLLIDAGNSSLKWAILNNGELEVGDPVVYQWGSFDQQLATAWQIFLDKKLIPTKIILANVAGQKVVDALSRWKEHALGRVLSVKETDELSIEIVVAETNIYGVETTYRRPETLGADRWAALVATRHHIKGDAIIVDCGTALTVDILTEDGVHQGGLIIPGWEMMERSLVMNTTGISSSDSEVPELLGITTQQAVKAGVSAACVGAVEHVANEYKNQNNGRELTCVITGGAAPMLLNKLMSPNHAFSKLVSSVRHEPDWVLMGLVIISGAAGNEILPMSADVLT